MDATLKKPHESNKVAYVETQKIMSMAKKLTKRQNLN
jgi:hypothetical protein